MLAIAAVNISGVALCSSLAAAKDSNNSGVGMRFGAPLYISSGNGILFPLKYRLNKVTVYEVGI